MRGLDYSELHAVSGGTASDPERRLPTVYVTAPNPSLIPTNIPDDNFGLGPDIPNPADQTFEADDGDDPGSNMPNLADTPPPIEAATLLVDPLGNVHAIELQVNQPGFYDADRSGDLSPGDLVLNEGLQVLLVADYLSAVGLTGNATDIDGAELIIQNINSNFFGLGGA